MTNPLDDKIAEIANIARQTSPEAQAAYLDEVCGRDLELRGDVERFLRQGSTRGVGTDTVLISTQAPTQPAVGSPGADIPHPMRVNAYRILDVLGEGSMGVVYRAEQQNPHREVALKVLKPGEASEAALRRFEQEGQMLGRLQHPGIAQIFEAGTSDTGYGPQPFFAMELIVGLPLNKYAVHRALGIRARLELLIKVCDGVQHAHQKGVIHRDLKPGNILVDNSGQPKILDFGIALAIDQMAEATISTGEYASLAGTIPYMSFEQVKGDPRELDTRTDVYALGVIGYQLLSGCLPHDLRSKTIADAVRIISQEVPRPLGEINKALRGDLETIIIKALAREKSDRYQTASALADDLCRYLSNEPILARPSSPVYVFRKLVQRNKAAAGGAVAVLLMFAVGLFFSMAFYLELENERVRAEENVAVGQRAVRRSNTIDRVLFPIFKIAAHSEDAHKMQTVQAALNQQATQLNNGTLSIDPKDEAAVHFALGKSYRELKLLDKAEPHLVAALEIDRHNLGGEDLWTLEDMDELALLYRAQGKFSEAEPLYRTVLNTRNRILGFEKRKTLETRHNLALLLDAMGQDARAERMYLEICEIERRVLPEEDPLKLSTTNALALLLKKTGRWQDAERLYRQTLKIRTRTLGDDHPDTLLTANNLAAVLKTEGKLSEAETLYRQTLTTRRRVLGDDHPNTLTSMNNLAIVLRAQRKWDEANTLYRETMALLHDTLGSGHPKTLKATISLATFLREQGKLSEAERLYRKALASLRSKPGDRHLATINAIYSLGVLLVQEKEYTEAERLLREALGLWREILPEDHPDIAVGAFKLGEVLLFESDYSAAEPLLRECLTLRRKRLKTGHWKTANAENALGDCAMQLGNLDEAKPLLVESYPVLKERFGHSDEHTIRAISRLARLYDALGEPARAAEYRRMLPDRAGDPPATSPSDRP